MCFDLSLMTAKFVIAIAQSLTTAIEIGLNFTSDVISEIILESQIASLVARHIAMYSASQDDVVTHVCFFDF